MFRPLAPGKVRRGCCPSLGAEVIWIVRPFDLDEAIARGALVLSDGRSWSVPPGIDPPGDEVVVLAVPGAHGRR